MVGVNVEGRELTSLQQMYYTHTLTIQDPAYCRHEPIIPENNHRIMRPPLSVIRVRYLVRSKVRHAPNGIRISNTIPPVDFHVALSFQFQLIRLYR
jgi:hypothetical protein